MTRRWGSSGRPSPAGNRPLWGVGVDVLLDAVRAHGGSVAGGPTDMTWGMRVAHVSDPDGHPIDLQCPIGD